MITKVLLRQILLCSIFVVGTCSLSLGQSLKGLSYDPGNKTGDGLMASYYNGLKYEKKIIDTVEKSINHVWEYESPYPNVYAYNFTAAWQGKIFVSEGAVYTFIIEANDGVRLWIQDSLIIKGWKQMPLKSEDVNIYKGKASLEGNKLYDFKLKYFQAGLNGSIKVMWQKGKDKPKLLDESFLYSKFETLESGTKFQLDSVNFEEGSDQIMPIAYIQLDDLIEKLEQYPTTVIEIAGHTDDQGDYDYNIKLSYDRANMVAKYLISKGISEKRISAKGYGYTEPLSDNSSEEGRSKNRRVEARVL